MAQSGFTPISLYFSATGAAVPTAGNLVAGELALNTNDGKLYYKNSSGVVTLLAGATSGPAGGSNTQVQYNNSGVLAGITGATTNGTALTLVAPNLGSPSSVGTMPAFTLGGTVSGGGNQINNVIIGTTTPLAGSFTGLSATSVNVGGTGSDALVRVVASGSQANMQLWSQFNVATNRNWAIISSNIAYGDLSFQQSNAQNGDPVAAGTTIMRLTSAGLAVTGTLSASPSGADNPIKVGATGTYGMITLNNVLGTDTGAGMFGGATADSGALYVAAPTKVYSRIGAVNITTATSTGLAVTGTLSATTGAAVGGATAGAGGLAFPATAVAVADANTLDDYEEGTWTPAFNGSTTNPTTTSGTPVGAYIKVGKLVWVSIEMAGVGYTGGSGNLLIAGLPFAASTTNGELASFYETTNAFPVGKTGLWGYTGNNTTNLNLVYAGGTAGTSQVLVSTASSWNMYTTLCYSATA